MKNKGSNLEVSNKNPLPPPFFTQETGPCGNQQQMNGDIWGWRVMDNNWVSSILPLPLSHLHRRSRSHIAVSDVAAIQLQTTMMHHNNQATSHYITNHNEDPTAPPDWTWMPTNEANHAWMEMTTHQRRRMPTNGNARPWTETNQDEGKQMPTSWPHANEDERPDNNGQHPLADASDGSELLLLALHFTPLPPPSLPPPPPLSLPPSPLHHSPSPPSWLVATTYIM